MDEHFQIYCETFFKDGEHLQDIWLIYNENLQVHGKHFLYMVNI